MKSAHVVRLCMTYHNDPAIDERGWFEATPHPTGDWVKYEEVQKVLAVLADERDAARAEVARLREALQVARAAIPVRDSGEVFDIIDAALAAEEAQCACWLDSRGVLMPCEAHAKVGQEGDRG